MRLITDDMLVDYLTGELPAEDRARLSAALSTDAELFGRLAELEMLVKEVQAQPEPVVSTTSDARFAKMLEAELSAAPAVTVRALPSRRAWVRRFAAAAAVLLVFTLGYRLGVDRDADQLSASRTLMLELMDAQRPSDRIRATTVTLSMTNADAGTIRDLNYLLRNDESANVRLAALDALRRFSADPAVVNLLLEAVYDSPPEVVRFELIETLVRMNETRLLPYLHDVMEADSLPQPVRDAAQLASFKLI